MAILSCHEAAGAVFQVTPGVACGGFHERGAYRFQAALAGVALYIDDALMECLPTAEGSAWNWQPGFYAGQVTAELMDTSGKRLAEYQLDVAPDAGKLGAELFQRMLQQIHTFDPALLSGTEAAQSSIGVAGDVSSPLLQYARLRRHGDGLLDALRDVARRPLTRLRHSREHVPFHRVRRIDAASARRLMSRPDTAALLGDSAASTGHPLPRVDVSHPFEDTDNPANRAMAAVLRTARIRCGAVAEALRKMHAAERDPGARTPLEQRMERRLAFLDHLAARLRTMARVSPYADVSRPEVSAAGLNAISAHPAYARAYRLGWSALRAGVAGDSRDEQLWLSPTWEIYERWCFVQVLSTLQARYPDLSWKRHAHSRADIIRFVGRAPGHRVEACLQRTFRSGGKGEAGLRSISMELKPDIIITAERQGERRLLVLDAKYRTDRPYVLDSMRSAHLYQDALRWDGERPVCTLLLIPRGGGAAWLEDTGFQQRHRVGVHVLAPGEPTEVLGEMLARWLEADEAG